MNKINPIQDTYFAAVGDVHGEMYLMLAILDKIQSKLNKSISFVLQVGDFEPHRNYADVMTMDAPSKYKKLGEFHHFYTKNYQFPYPIYFIGGNHEPYGFLDRLPPKVTEIASNCYYLGRVGCLELAGLKIVGVSGIYKAKLFDNRPPISQINSRSNSDYIGFTYKEINQAIDYQKTDILLLHEWANNIVAEKDQEILSQYLPRRKYEEIGNEYASYLIEILQPRLVLCGHMHFPYRNSLSFPDGNSCHICCLANVTKGREAMAIFHLSSQGKITEIPIH